MLLFLFLVSWLPESRLSPSEEEQMDEEKIREERKGSTF